MRTILILGIVGMLAGCMPKTHVVGYSVHGNEPQSVEVMCKHYQDCLEKAVWFCSPHNYHVYSSTVGHETICYWSVMQEWICEEQLRHRVRARCLSDI